VIVRAAVVAISALAVAGAGRAADVGRPGCRTADFSIAVGFQISPATGENPLTLRMKNRGPRACVLFGYPAVSLADRRGVIPFAIWHGGDQMVTARRPAEVLVRPGRSAFVLLNKFRCDLGEIRLARTLRLGFPRDTSRRLSLVLPRYPSISYCRGDFRTKVTASPFEPTLAAAMKRH
jgi:hypothetical protein